MTTTQFNPESTVFGSTYVTACYHRSVNPHTTFLRGDLPTHHFLTLPADIVMKEEEWDAIGLGIKKDTSLRVLRVATSERKEDTVRDKAKKGLTRTVLMKPRVQLGFIKAVKQNLEESRALVELELNGVQWTQASLQMLNTGLIQNASLKKLTIARGQLKDDDLSLLSQGIKSAISLQYLALPCNHITSKGAQTLARIIKFQFVVLSSEDWVESLRTDHWMESPRTIKRVNLCYNQIQDDGAKALSDELKDVPGIHAVDLQFNDISSSGAKYLINLAEINNDLVVVDIRNNSVGKRYMDMLHQVLEKNRNEYDLHMKNTAHQETRGNECSVNAADLAWLDEKQPLLGLAHMKHHVESPEKSSTTKKSKMSLKATPKTHQPNKTAKKIKKTLQAISPRKPHCTNRKCDSCHDVLSLWEEERQARMSSEARLNNLENHVDVYHDIINNVMEDLRASPSVSPVPLISHLDDAFPEHSSHDLPDSIIKTGVSYLDTSMIPDTISFENHIPVPSNQTLRQQAQGNNQMDQLLRALEVSLVGFNQLMDRIEKRESRRRSKKTALLP